MPSPYVLYKGTSATLATLPSTGKAGLLLFTTDTLQVYVDSGSGIGIGPGIGTAWIPVSGGGGGGGVTQLVAGTNITLSPAGGTGTVTVASIGGGGSITDVVAGTGLNGGGSSGSVTLNLDVPVSVDDGGTGTGTPALVAGTGISISGSWPDQTIAATGILPANTPGIANKWLWSYDPTTGLFTQTQPAFSNVSGVATPAQIGTGTPAGGDYVDGGTGAWTPLPIATPSVRGLVSPDGTIITDTAGAITVAKASAVAFGVVEVDGTTIASMSGVISAILPSGAANQVLATPNGSSGIAANRYLVIADLPASVQMAPIGVTLFAVDMNNPQFVEIYFNGTIASWTLIGDAPGSASVDVWFEAGSAPPAAPPVPTVANKISASAPISVSSAQSAAGGTSTWTTNLTQWGMLAFNLTAMSGMTKAFIQIQGTRN